MKTQPMNKAERSLYEMHCTYGATFGRTLGLAPLALTVIQEHHEAFDGTGYPKGLVGESAHLLSRIVAITNYYDYLCNPAVLTDALTPHEALSLMYTKLRSKFDPKLLQVFIRCLGAYPPGTLVLLSNGATGIVTGINAARPMRPMVVVYDADVPKDEAIVLDLVQETEINITKAMRPAQIPTEICSYLGLRKRVSYYFSASPDGVQPHTP
jgi:HD-GYP domain-containing protein (c-di-GMP phosphodiesterase class II)